MLPRPLPVAAVAALLLLTAPSASAQIPLPIPTVVPTVVPGVPSQGPGAQPYQANDGKGFRDILPPGTRGRYNAAELAAFLSTGATVPHCCDQLGMYRDLMYATPGLQPSQIPDYFKDASFGVPEGQAERTYSPREDVTIVRDRSFGVPHIYGATRDGAMFGTGYAAAEDRLFFMDVLRHAGRAELSTFAGGSNAAMDAEQWEVAPYTEADLERQATRLPDFLGDDGRQIQRDVANYIAGINAYISETSVLEQPPGARLRRARRERLFLRVPLAPARGSVEGQAPRRAQADPARGRGHHGGGGHGRPARPLRAAGRVAGRRAPQGRAAARRRRAAAAVAASGRAPDRR